MIFSILETLSMISDESERFIMNSMMVLV